MFNDVTPIIHMSESPCQMLTMFGESSPLVFQDFVSSQDRVDIYQKLINLQEELKKLQEAEQLLSSALSKRYTNVAL